MDYKEVIAALKNDQLSNLYLFYGNETYLIEHTLHTIKEKLLDPHFLDLNYQVMDGKEITIGELMNACETLPFMGDKRMLIIKDSEYFTNKRKGISEEEEERLISYLADIPETTYLFFQQFDEIDKRKKTTKAVGQHGKVVEFSKLTGKDASKWVQKTFGKYGKTIDDGNISYFLEITGYLDRNSNKSLKDLENEIVKLVHYVDDRKAVKEEDISSIAVKTLDNDIFLLVESIGEKNGDKSLALLNDMLIGGESEIKILFMITRQFRYLYQMKLLEAQGYTAMAIAPKLGIQQFVVKKYIRQAMNFDVNTLRKALEECLLTDSQIKKGKIEQRLGIELLICKFASIGFQ
ncbi:MAG: DNA polymerase III subunit delta [Bacillota bacterium]